MMKPWDIKNRKQLFIDERFIARSEGISLSVNPPVKKERVLRYEMPWEDMRLGGYATVLEDDGIFKLWYDAFVGLERYRDVPRSLCHAVSPDGIHWERPKLNLFNWRGRTDNNIVMPGTDGGVMLDPLAPEEHRYKALCIIQPNPLWAEARDVHWDISGGCIHLLTSPDGIHWKRVSPPASPFFHDSQNVLLYDDRICRYVAYLRTHERGRTVGRVELDDPTQTPWPFRKPAGIEPNIHGLYTGINHGEFDTVMACDEDDAPDSDVQQAPVVRYPWADDVYLALATIYRHYTPPNENQPQGGRQKDGKFSNDGPQDVQLAVSRDGITWQRPERRPYIPLGFLGDWDGGCIWPALGMVRHANEVWQYYCGTRHTHGYRDPKMVGDGGLCRIVQRLDGFVSADAGPQGGQIVTPPLRFKGESLEINVDCTAQGMIRVELLDEAEQPIPGYALAEAEPIDRNPIAARVQWTSGKEVGSLQGRTIRLRFHMRSCKLYAFQFTG